MSLSVLYVPVSSLVKVNIHNPAILTMSTKKCQLIVIIINPPTIYNILDNLLACPQDA